MSYKKTDVTPKELKILLHSKRSQIYLLERCRVLRKDGRVVYLTSEENQKAYYNIPIANTTVLLLGMGTSISQEAIRMLASAGVMVGFCGTNGVPLFAGTDASILWMNPQCEYRPTQYTQCWYHFWGQDSKRLEAAKIFQQERIAFLKYVWKKDPDLQNAGFSPDDDDIAVACDNYADDILTLQNTTGLLLSEAEFTKRLYKAAASRTDFDGFFRDYHGSDPVNGLLTHGNYLAYGLGACCCWVLGLPHALPVMHGKTRRGGLVFDVADLIKDILVLPFAFISAREGLNHKEFRDFVSQKFLDYKALDHMFDVVERVAMKWPCEGMKGLDDHAGNLYVDELQKGSRIDSKSS